MSGLTRRAFLARGAALGASLPLGVAAIPGPAAGKRREGLGPITVFSKHLQWLEYEELADVVAEAGFDGIDLTVRPGGHVLPERVTKDLPRAVRAARSAGLVVPLMTTAITRARDPATRRILATGRDEGIQAYRMGYLGYPEEVPIASALDGMRPLIQELAELNEQFGLHGAYQNHSGTGVGGPVWDLAYLLRGVNPRWLGVQYDIAHATVEGGTAWPLGLRLLAPYIRTVDVKDFLWAERPDRWVPRWVPLGDGMVDYPRYLRMVDELRISGPISLHFEYPPLEGPSDLSRAERRQEAIRLMRRDLERLRALLAEAGLAAGNGEEA
ncbi:MAG TPA: sugar phosphate isomerase/epimerase family protein [Longimicrobiaceae bacterium]